MNLDHQVLASAVLCPMGYLPFRSPAAGCAPRDAFIISHRDARCWWDPGAVGAGLPRELPMG